MQNHLYKTATLKWVTALIIVLFLLPAMTFAIEKPPTSPIKTVEDLEGAMDKIFGLAFWLLTVVAIFLVLFAGFKYLTASGDPEKMKQANRQLLFSAIAIAIALIAKGVPALIQDVLS
ncbi:MAG: hypothetical protein AAB495_00890 [Patescibacteria group bacterium]